jgi:DNA-binding response OmpR family regulator
MNRKALIVTVDETIVPVAEDTIESLDHELVHAQSQAEARKLARENRFDYIVIDIAIPARRNGRSIEPVHGFHLLEEIRGMSNGSDVPIIICAGNTDCLDYVEDYLDKGATAFISKPFTSRLLARKIRSALKRERRSAAHSKPQRCKKFQGGELIIRQRVVSISGINVPITTQVRRLLLELAARRVDGKLVALSGEELAQKLKLLRGQNAVAELVCHFRKRAAELLAESGSKCGNHDLIRSGGPGYRFNRWLTVTIDEEIRITSLRHTDRDPVNEPDQVHSAPVKSRCDPDHDPDDLDGDPVNLMRDPDHDPGDPHGDPANLTRDPDHDPVTARQSRIIRFLKKGDVIRVGDVVRRLDCSHSTAKRELTRLRMSGLIRFVGHPRTGSYQLIDQ